MPGLSQLAKALPAKMEVDYKSARAPKDPPVAGKVAVVVGKTFEELVASNDADVLIEVCRAQFPPVATMTLNIIWCGPCQTLAVRAVVWTL
eukprot:SAG31_NODE_3945_length_3729_cov_4.246832_2_plen_91_part_00